MSEETETHTSEREPLPGESDYARARKMPHHAIPDFTTDGEYLELLGKSAAQGYSRAMAKLGEYALRRRALVESHYWLCRARKAGVRGLDMTLHIIRKNWAAAGYQKEGYNRHPLFTDDDAAKAVALLELSVGRNRATAQAFVREHCPELQP